MTKRIAALTFIFLCTAVAWAILAATITARTYTFDARLKQGVASLWGAPQVQVPPTAAYTVEVQEKIESLTDGKKTVSVVTTSVERSFPLDASRIHVDLDLEHRQKGLLWYSTYKAVFDSVYTFRNDTDEEQRATFRFKLPPGSPIYDGLTMQVNGQTIEPLVAAGEASVLAVVPARQNVKLRVACRTNGLDSWGYSLGRDVAQARDFQLTMTTNFKDIDFASDTLSPSRKEETAKGWRLTWRYESLVSGFQIGMTMPEKLQPGPLAGQISYFAPVSLFMFFFLMFVITTLRNIELHPMNYFFLAAAFFAFHLLLAYLVDHISIHAAFAAASAVSVFLVVSYLRLAVGWRFAAVEAGGAQLVYLVLFSYAFFFKGFTGLAVTIGAIVTLFVVMQMTGRIRWAEKFGSASGSATALLTSDEA